MDIGAVIGLNTCILVLVIGLGFVSVRGRLDRIAVALEKLHRGSDED